MDNNLTLESTRIKTKDSDPISILVIKQCLNLFENFGELLNPNSFVYNEEIPRLLESKYPLFLKQGDISQIKNLINRYTIIIVSNKKMDYASNQDIPFKFRSDLCKIIEKDEESYLNYLDSLFI